MGQAAWVMRADPLGGQRSPGENLSPHRREVEKATPMMGSKQRHFAPVIFWVFKNFSWIWHRLTPPSHH